MLFGSHSEVGHGSFLFLIFDDFVSFGWYFGLIGHEKLFYLLSCSVSAGIIYKDNMIILVFLHDDRKHVVVMSVLVNIVIAGNHYAKRKFLVLTYVVSLFIVGTFFISERRGMIKILVF